MTHRGTLPLAVQCLPGVAGPAAAIRISLPFFITTFFSPSPLSLSTLPHLRAPKPMKAALFQPVCPSGNKKPGELRGQRDETTGRPNLWTSATCHQGTLTRYLSVAKKTLRPSFKPWSGGGGLEGRLMSHLAVLVDVVPGSSALKKVNLHLLFD